jgi:hypothetical protein
VRHRISDHVEHRRSPILTQTHHILIFGKTTRRYLRWFIPSLSGKVLVSMSFWFVGNRKGFSNRENRSGVGLVVQSGSEPCVTNNPNDIVLHLLSTSLFCVSQLQNSMSTSIKYNRVCYIYYMTSNFIRFIEADQLHIIIPICDWIGITLESGMIRSILIE